MKLTQLIPTIFLSAILLVSCSTDEVFDTIEQKSEVSESIKQNTEVTNGTTLKTTSASVQVSTITPKAYIFVEPHSKSVMIANYLNNIPQSSSFNRRFLGFFVGPGVAVQHNLLHYIDMPHWYDGRLPSIIQAEIPQVNGGIDEYGNPKIAYNFTTVKIQKNTVSGFGWINILIPVSAMSNDTKRQKSIFTYEKIGERLVTNGTVQRRIYNTNSVMYNYTFNYQGNRIPKGVYRLYTTYPDPGMRANLNTTKDFYLRGNSN
jgi:hypothetical protein